MDTIINFDKIRRFEKSLEKTNKSIVTAQFWNEVDRELGRVEAYVSDVEESNFGLHVRYYNFLDTIAAAEKAKQMGLRAINQSNMFRRIINK